MLPSHVGIRESKSGNIIAIKKSLLGGTEDYTHCYLVDHQYRCDIIGVLNPRFPLPEEYRKFPSFQYEGWTFYNLQTSIPSDQACHIAESIKHFTKADAFLPTIPTPFTAGECVPKEVIEGLPDTRGFSTGVGAVSRGHYGYADKSLLNVRLTTEDIAKVCPLMRYFLNNPDRIAITDKGYSFFTGVINCLNTEFNLQQLSSACLRNHVPATEFVYTCQAMAEAYPNRCGQCYVKEEYNTTALDKIAVTYMCDRISTVLASDFILDMSLEEIAELLKPIVKLPGNELLNLVRKTADMSPNALKRRSGQTPLNKALRKFWEAKEKQHPMKTLLDAYAVQCAVTAISVSRHRQAEEVYKWLNNNGAIFGYVEDKATITHMGKTYTVSNNAEYIAFMAQMTGFQDWNANSLEFHKSLQNIVFQKGIPLSDNKGIIGEYQGDCYLYSPSKNPIESSWRNLYTGNVEQVPLVYGGALLKDIEWIPTTVKRLHQDIRNFGGSISMEPESAMTLFCYMVSGALIDLIPSMWIKPLVVRTKPEDVRYHKLLMPLLSYLYYGYDYSFNIPLKTIHSHKDSNIAEGGIKFYSGRNGATGFESLQKKSLVIYFGLKPEDEGFYTEWNPGRAFMVPQGYENLKEKLIQRYRNLIFSTAAHFLRVYGYENIVNDLNNTLDPHVFLVEQLRSYCSKEYDITPDNAASFIPALILNYYRKYGELPVERALMSYKREDVFRIPTAEVKAFIDFILADTNMTLHPKVTIFKIKSLLLDTGRMKDSLSPLWVVRQMLNEVAHYYIHIVNK